MQHPRIEVLLRTTVDAALLQRLEPDEILVATGASRAAPAIEGAQQTHVWSGDELRRLMTGDGAEEIAKAKLSLAERARLPRWRNTWASSCWSAPLVPCG